MLGSNFKHMSDIDGRFHNGTNILHTINRNDVDFSDLGRAHEELKKFKRSLYFESIGDTIIYTAAVIPQNNHADRGRIELYYRVNSDAIKVIHDVFPDCSFRYISTNSLWPDPRLGNYSKWDDVDRGFNQLTDYEKSKIFGERNVTSCYGKRGAIYRVCPVGFRRGGKKLGKTLFESIVRYMFSDDDKHANLFKYLPDGIFSPVNASTVAEIIFDDLDRAFHSGITTVSLGGISKTEWAYAIDDHFSHALGSNSSEKRRSMRSLPTMGNFFYGDDVEFEHNKFAATLTSWNEVNKGRDSLAHMSAEGLVRQFMEYMKDDSDHIVSHKTFRQRINRLL